MCWQERAKAIASLVRGRGGMKKRMQMAILQTVPQKLQTIPKILIKLYNMVYWYKMCKK